MKTKLIILIALVTLTFSCADNKTIDNVTYRPYGLLNKETCKNDSIYYEVSLQAVASGIIFSELFLIPTIYTFGFNLYEPICKKSELVNEKKGVVHEN